MSCAADQDCLNGEQCDPALLLCMPSDVLPLPPVIEEFSVMPQTISRPGQEVRLTYRTRNTSSISIEPGVLANAMFDEGMELVHPTDSTEYTLLARGPGGEVSLRRSVALVGGSVAIVEFSSAPMEATPGDTVTLTFEVENAEAGSVAITEPSFPRVVDTALPDRGTIGYIAHSLPVELWLEARGEDRTRVRRPLRILEVLGGQVEVVLDALPRELDPGDTSILEWTTRNATELRLAENGSEIAVLNDRFDVGRGFQLIGPMSTTLYEAAATGPNGKAHAGVEVSVLKRSPPVIQELSVTPQYRDFFMKTEAVVVWAVEGASEVALYENDTLVGMFSAEDTYTARLRRNLHYRLEAKSADGSYAEAQVSSWLMDSEHQLFADNSIDDIARNATLIVIDPADRFPIRVHEEGTLDVFVTDRNAQCDPSIPMSMELYAQNGDMVDFGTDIDGCLRIRRNDLPPGNYVVELDSPNRVEYSIFGRFARNICGDDLLAGSEQCEDGDRISGDGCSDVCENEPVPTYTVEVRGAQMNEPELLVQPITFNDGAALVRLPFELQFFANRYRGLYIREDGFLVLRPEDRTTAPSPSLISEARPNAVIAAFMSEMKLADFPDAKGEVISFLDPGPGPDRRRYTVLYRNLTGETHTVDTRILFDAAISIEENTGIIRIIYGPLRVDGFVRNFDFVMGIEDASGRYGYSAPGCETSCGDPSRVRNKQFTFTPEGR